MIVVYSYYSHEGACLYVGQTSDLSGRHRNHCIASPWMDFSTGEPRVLSVHSGRSEALVAEREAIKVCAPKFNVMHNEATRAACGECGRSAILRGDGRLPQHRTRDGIPCPGGHHMPREQVAA